MKSSMFCAAVLAGLICAATAQAADSGGWWLWPGISLHPPCCCCCDDYNPKPLPCTAPYCCCGCDDYCGKPLPCTAPFCCFGCDDYCGKPLPCIAPLCCGPNYTCGPPAPCMNAERANYLPPPSATYQPNCHCLPDPKPAQ